MGTVPTKSFAAAFAAKTSLVDTLDEWGNIDDYCVPPKAPVSTFWDKPNMLPLDQPIDLDKNLSIYHLENSLVEYINKKLSSPSSRQMSLFCSKEINTPFSSCNNDSYISETTKSILGPIFDSLEQLLLDTPLTSMISSTSNESGSELAVPIESKKQLAVTPVVTPIGTPIENNGLPLQKFHEQLIEKLISLHINSDLAESSASSLKNKESTHVNNKQGPEFLQKRKNTPDRNPLNKEFLTKLKNIQGYNSSFPFVEITKEIPKNDLKLTPTEGTEVRIKSSLIFTYPESYGYKISRIHTQRLSLVNYNLDCEFCLFRRNPDFSSDSHYLPEFLKIPLDEEGQPESMNGLCPYCPALIFLNMENESYTNHLSTVHGVYSDNSLSPEPVMVGKFRIKRPGSFKKKKERNTLKTGSDGAVCPICHVIVQIDTNVSNERVMAKYLKHFHIEHKEKELKKEELEPLGQSLDHNSQSVVDTLSSQIDHFTNEAD